VTIGKPYTIHCRSAVSTQTYTNQSYTPQSRSQSGRALQQGAWGEHRRKENHGPVKGEGKEGKRGFVAGESNRKDKGVSLEDDL